MHLGPSGSSFTLRLLVLVLVPLLGLGLLTFDRIEAESEQVAAARSLVDQARLQQSVAAVYGPAQLEQIALEGLATIDELGVPRDLVVAIAGVDFEGIYDTNAVELDAALDRLAARHGDLEIVDAASGETTTLASRLSFIRGQLASERRLSKEFAAGQDGVRSVFASLDQLLAEALATVSSLGFDLDGGAERSSLDALGDVLVAAGERGKALLDGLLDRSEETAFGIVAGEARFELAVETFSGLIDDQSRIELEAVLAQLVPVPASLITTAQTESIAVEMDPSYIQDSAGAVLDQQAFLKELEGFSERFHTSVVDTLEARAVGARSAAISTTILFGAIALLSLVLMIVVALTTLRPLRRLARRAASISDGSFDAQPLPPTGPSDVRTLTRAMNEMMVTLRTVDQELSSLADGDMLGGSALIPGDIGLSLRRSFQRLGDTASRLHASQQLASAIVEQAADAIWTIDSNGIIRSANDASITLLGVAEDAQVGTPLRLYLSTTNGQASVENFQGEPTRLLVRNNPIDGGDEPLSTVIAHDISERLRYEERLSYQAHHDALTGLPNRFAVLERLESVGDASLGVLFVDLDGFKSVNDTQGHLAGDAVLTEVAQRLVRHIRPGDFVGRLGGDEFVILMHDYERPADVVSFGYRLIREVEQPHGDGDNLFMLSASIGVATFPEGIASTGITSLEAIRRADSAVYVAKRRGRGRVELFDAELQASIVRDAEIENALRRAVRNDELEMYLQPVLDVTSGEFCGAEALARWICPEHGMISPGEFIPVAERSSLIFEIGRWMLGKACETVARWRVDDPDSCAKIAVNIAGSHLIDGNILADLDAALLLTGADPTMLEFELTETQLMDDFARATAVLREIRARGITVAIDDFGTGYSSMAYLRELPIDTLKIDRSFVADIVETGFDSTVIDALLTIGHALGLSVVAEGIEHLAQLDYLTARGCDRAQGFHIAHPMPVPDAEFLMRRIDVAVETR